MSGNYRQEHQSHQLPYRHRGRGYETGQHREAIATASTSNLGRPPPTPSFFPGAASLFEQLDKRLLIVMRDGRHLVGTLRRLVVVMIENSKLILVVE